MIITLIIIGIVIGAIVCWIIEKKTYENWAWYLSVSLTILAVIGVLIVSAMIICAQSNKDVDYQNKLHEREMLEYRIDHMEDNLVGNEMLYNDIVKFNNELRDVKKWANNPWTNWFYNQDIAAMDYVEIDRE